MKQHLETLRGTQVSHSSSKKRVELYSETVICKLFSSITQCNIIISKKQAKGLTKQIKVNRNVLFHFKSLPTVNNPSVLLAR